MAASKPTIERAATVAEPNAVMAVVAPAVGWLIPGAGHLLQKRWTRGLLLMVSVVAMFALGLLMEGKLSSPNTGDITGFALTKCTNFTQSMRPSA